MVDVHDEQPVHDHMLLMAPRTVAVVMPLAVNPPVSLESPGLEHDSGQGVLVSCDLFLLPGGQGDISMPFKHGDLLQAFTVSRNITPHLLVLEQTGEILQRLDQDGWRPSPYFCADSHPSRSSLKSVIIFLTAFSSTSFTNWS